MFTLVKSGAGFLFEINLYCMVKSKCILFLCFWTLEISYTTANTSLWLFDILKNMVISMVFTIKIGMNKSTVVMNYFSQIIRDPLPFGKKEERKS